MTITPVQSAGNTAAVPHSGGNVVVGSGQSWATPTTNNLIVVTVSEQQSLGGMALADISVPTAAGSQPFVLAADDGAPGQTAGKTFWKKSEGGESTITCAVAPGNVSFGGTVAVEVVEWSGFSVWANDAHPAGNNFPGNTNNFSAPASGVLADPSEVVVSTVTIGNTFSSPSAGTFTLVRHGSQTVSIVGYVITSATTSQQMAATWATTRQPSGMTASFMQGTTPATPSAVPLTLAEPAPSLTIDSSATPSAVAQTLAVPTPTITTDGNPTPTQWDMPLAILTPSFTISNAITPSTFDMPLAVPAPSVIVGTIAFPTEVAMPLAVPAPSLTYDMTVFPTEDQWLFADPGAAPTTLVTATPTTIPLTFAPTVPSLFTSADGIVTLIGKFTDDNGLPSTGLLRFAMPITLLNTSTAVRYPPTWVEVTLDSTGSFQIQLPATDVAAFTPTDRVWEVTEWIDQKARTYSIPLTSSPPIQYLAALAPQT